MTRPRARRRAHPRVVVPPAARTILLAIGLALVSFAPARAQTVRPWVPPGADSLVHWAAEAKVRFRENTGDTVGGSNYRAYELVGTMGRRLVRSLGKRGVPQAHAVEGVLDSLGLDTDVEVETVIPNFVLLMVRNPYKFSARAVAFMYWYQGDDLRMQSALFEGGMNPSTRVWWTAQPDAPYSWAIVDQERGPRPRTYLTLFRLNPSGKFWMPVQFGPGAPDLGEGSRVAWIDTNNDLKPEIVVFAEAETDSLFALCQDCPRILNEVVFIERPDGFHLHDSRVLPTPYSTFDLFVRYLMEGNRPAASRLAKTPELVQRAVDAGWGLKARPGAWRVDSVEPNTAWPQWLVVSRPGAKGRQRYRVNFELSRGRWIVSGWTSPQAAGAQAPPGRAGSK